MDYRETLEFLFNSLPAYQRIGKAAYKADLETSRKLDEYFGHPHKGYPSIHIAGTNGKGSVSHMLTSILMEAGYTTGLYTSPHLLDFRERIKVNGEMVDQSWVVQFVEDHRGIIEELKPSFFEMTAAMAFLYFASRNVDVAVIETGMGGRLDSTNVIDPMLSVITNIGYDHMQFLGDTLGKIAVEKAGIIKAGIPVVVGESNGETDSVFTSVAERMGSPIHFADREYDVEITSSDPGRGRLEYSACRRGGEELITGEIPLGGNYQLKNIRTVLMSCRLITMPGADQTRNITAGLRNVISNTGLSGRWQVLGQDPLVICDTAHNREGLSMVIEQLSSIPAGRMHFVLGFVNDKELAPILPLFPVDADYYFTRADIPRSLDSDQLMSSAAGYNLRGRSYSMVKDAFSAAMMKASPGDLVYVGGSTFVVADLLSFLKKGQP